MESVNKIRWIESAPWTFNRSSPFGPTRTAALKIGAPLLAFCLILLAPLPPGLTEDGQRTLAIMALVVALWATEVVPVAVAGIFGVVLLMLLGGAAEMGVALYGFSPAGDLLPSRHPHPWFGGASIGVGRAVSHLPDSRRRRQAPEPSTYKCYFPLPCLLLPCPLPAPGALSWSTYTRR